MSVHHTLWVVSGLVALVGCAEGAAELFATEVVPVLERRCATAACHGVEPGVDWPSAEGFFVRLDARGRIASAREAREVALERVSVRAPRASSLLRVPAPTWLGGGPHAGGPLFDGPDDDAARVFHDWIALEERGGEDLELNELERLFADTVAPVLVQRCARDGCHGPTDIAFLAFPLPVIEGQITDVDLVAARLATRKLLDLWGTDPRQSRLIRKALGEHSGGLVHRGDRTTFFPEAPVDAPFDAPGLQAILAWANAERAALGVEATQPTAVVYVDAPIADRAPYRIEHGSTGGDLWLAGWPDPGIPRNLTAHLHPEGAVEIRDVAVSHDGARVAFSMRSDEEHAIWELVLATGSARRVTSSEGSFVQPTYAADGRIVAVWDGHGELAADGDGVAPELVAIDDDGRLERLTYTPAPEVAPSTFASGKTRGELAFATRRQGVDVAEGLLFRFPLCHDARLHGEPEYHVHFGASIAPLAPLYARDLPDGRQLVTLLSSTMETDDRGGLAVLDRSLGPHLADLAEASLSGYRRPLQWLDEGTHYRDPAALPDGRFLVSADREGAPGEDAIWIGGIVDDEAGASLGGMTRWLARPGRSLRSATPVFARPLEDDSHEETTSNEAATGFIVLRDVAVLETLFGRAEPRGSRELRDDIVGLRVLASEGALASEVARLPEGGTTVGLSDRIPVRVLAEVPLPDDRSAWIGVPARTPLRIAYIDALGMQVGRSLDRWFFAEGNETVPGGANVPTYARACAGCHGAMSGDPDEAVAPRVDAISSASITLSTHRDRNPRAPLEPLALTDGELVDWTRTIAPRLDACTDCHGGESPSAGLSLQPGAGIRFDSAYEALVEHVDLDTLRARRSVLMERLVGRELEAPGTPNGVCPPDGPDDELVTVFARWIEAGAFFELGGDE